MTVTFGLDDLQIVEHNSNNLKSDVKRKRSSVVTVSEGEGPGDDDELVIVSIKKGVSPVTRRKTNIKAPTQKVFDLTRESSTIRKHPFQSAAALITPTEPKPVNTTIKCSVCLDQVSHPTSTICGHLFCEACLRLSVRETGKCPACRKKLTLKQIHRVFF